MLYRIFKVLVGLSYFFYFKKIKVTGRQYIPKQGPVLFISNHPSSFMEAMLIACFQHRSLHFLVRGDMFEKNWLKPILQWTNQIPIFRQRDGFEKLRNNKSTFEYSFNKLAEGACILIFPEASTQMVRFLRPLQKGAARLAIGSMTERELKDLTVIPCGVRFRNVLKTGTEVGIHFGPGISVKTFLEQNAQTTDKLDQITRIFTQALEDLVLSVPENIREDLYDQLDHLEPSTNSEQQDVQLRSLRHLRIVKALTEHGQSIKSLVHQYHQGARSYIAIDRELSLPWIQRARSFFQMLLMFFLGIPGALIYGLPLELSRWFAFRKIRSKEFIAPVRLAVSICLVLLVSLLWTLVILLKFDITTGLFCFVLGIGSLYSFVKFLHFADENRYFMNLKINRNKENRLMVKKKILDLIAER